MIVILEVVILVTILLLMRPLYPAARCGHVQVRCGLHLSVFFIGSSGSLQSGSGPGRIVDALIAEANGRGGLDNITAIVIQVVGVGATAVGANG